MALGMAQAPLAFASSTATPAGQAAGEETTQKWCAEIRKAVTNLKWKMEPCVSGVEWKTSGTSLEGRPLMYAEFGDAAALQNTTLILSAVHGDEITPVYLGFQLVNWLKDHSADLKGIRVVVAPLVNPDGFYRKPRTRMNARGVDVNRNFATRDWERDALKTWKNRFKSDPRRYPGSASRSEPETVFQEDLIKSFRPQKVLSVHAPLNFMDYDGPNNLSLKRFPREYIQECLRLRKELKAVSSGFFTGSLGNFAGHELGIPTITLELPTADPRQAETYWKKFNTGIRTMIEYVVPTVEIKA
jgi:protein MpaA